MIELEILQSRVRPFQSGATISADTHLMRRARTQAECFDAVTSALLSAQEAAQEAERRIRQAERRMRDLDTQPEPERGFRKWTRDDIERDIAAQRSYAAYAAQTALLGAVSAIQDGCMIRWPHRVDVDLNTILEDIDLPESWHRPMSYR